MAFDVAAHVTDAQGSTMTRRGHARRERTTSNKRPVVVAR